MFAPLQQLPVLDGDAINQSLAYFRDQAFVWPAAERRYQAQWLRWGINQGWVAAEAVEQAFAGNAPWQHLSHCTKRVTQGLGEHLNGVFNAVFNGRGDDDSEAEQVIHLQHAIGSDYSARPLISLAMGEPLWLSVGSLHTAHPMVASLAYATINLVSLTCLPCALPHDLRAGYYSYYLDELFYDLDALAKDNGPLHAEDVVAYYTANDESDEAYYFSYWADDCESLLSAYRLSREPAPSWMAIDASRAKQNPADVWQRLRRRLHRVQRLRVEESDALWVAFVADALARLAPLVGGTSPYNHERNLTGDIEGNALDLGWVVTSDPIERVFVEGIFQTINETGEYPQEHFLAEAPDDDLLGLLTTVVTGCALLLNADRTNEAVKATDPVSFAFENDHA